MRYFIIETLGDDQDRTLAFIDKAPEIGLFEYCMARGEAIGDRYPNDVKIWLQSESPGIKLPALLGNCLSYLIVNSEMKEIIATTCKTSIEFLQFTLMNHKQRVHSKDYWIINPLGSIDCLNKDLSEIKYLDSSKTKVVSVGKFVIDPRKLSEPAHLFRVPEDITRYFISAQLAKAFQERNCTNIFLFEVDQSPED